MSSISDRLSQFATSKLGLIIDDVGLQRCIIVAPAHQITENSVNRILSLSGGLTFVAISPQRASAFLLPLMSRDKHSSSSTAPIMRQYVSVEAREGVSTGISTADRATTLRILGAGVPQPRALVKPGHLFPVETRNGGVLVRAAIPEAALDIVTLSGFPDAALFMELLDQSGEAIARDEACSLGTALHAPVFSISELIQYRLAGERLVTRTASAILPTREAGDVRAIVYRSTIHDVEHIALVKGSINSDHPVLVRVQSEHTLSDVFGGSHPDSRKHLQNSLRAIGERGSGVVLYIRRALLPGVPRDNDPAGSDSSTTTTMREYGVGAQILRDLGAVQIELLSSTPRTLVGLSSFGISVVRQLPIPEFNGAMELTP